ncbi:hypothetical protein VI817_007367 [Penicillium citrinum]|nr:hypothetical protein VI817_007367 [Penicillium citrinum]
MATVSSTEVLVNYHVVRLIHGPQGEDFSNMKQERVHEIPAGSFQGRFQVARPGSYAIMDEQHHKTGSSGLRFSICLEAHLPVESDHIQTIVSTLDVKEKTGYAVVINDAAIEFWIGNLSTIDIVKTGAKIMPKTWTTLDFTISESTLTYVLTPNAFLLGKTETPESGRKDLGYKPAMSGPSTLVLAASFASSPSEVSEIPTNFFNGRLEGPIISTGGLEEKVLAQWDFSVGISTDKVFDVAGTGAQGILVNAPLRAVTGHDWDGSEPDWTKARAGYGAIHFHEDDMDDAAWQTDISISLPKSLRSGAYAVEVHAADGTVHDSIPFFVRPTPSTSDALGAKLAYVLSTFTYLAYANEHVYDRAHLTSEAAFEWEVRRSQHTDKTERRVDLGFSCYDIHNDRSGVVHSSAKRPILNMRPDYISWNFHRPRGFSADLIGLEFLERSGIPYDVICDQDLHTHGYSALSRYGTVITGSHPEYHTFESLQAHTEFVKHGGNLMYLGGNGFYWSCATKADSLHRVEIRRGDQGCRPFTLGGGDRIFSTNGQQGLLWRSRGLAANYFLGVGCCAAGAGPGVPYKRTNAGQDATMAWVFKGIPPDELIGVDGFGGGASGDEIDKCDFALGSPRSTITLATSVGHPDDFFIFPEDAEFPMLKTTGTQTNEIRSDMTYNESGSGGAVFSVGSINWLCSLGWKNFENNVAQLTDNVIREFVRRHK